MLAELLPLDVFAVFLVFVRIAAALMLLPGIGEAYVSVQIRLAAAAVLTVAISPLVIGTLPILPATPLELLMLILGELVVGVLIGAAARLMMSALHVAGTVIAFQSSLGFALFIDPTQGTQGALIAAFLSLLGLVLIFATGLHMMMIRALADSYVLFTPGQMPPVGDFAALAVRYVSSSFRIGIQIAAPFIVFGLVFYIGLGILARLLPQIQIFFIGIPLQIFLSLTIFGLVLAPMMIWFLDHFEVRFVELLADR
ncbi:MAG: flagellar biosynthetic protein FliR [Alphaproteobacteria bacterium]|jgi:flagellar biosynthetic protein FliR|nr:flagellar biosynthetic protein FliR [Alphaproteobacteria bacterium]